MSRGHRVRSLLCACLLHEFVCLALPVHGAAVILARLPRRLLRAWAVSAVTVLAGPAPLAVFSTRQSAQIGWLMWPEPLHTVKAGTKVGMLTVGNGESTRKVPVALQQDLVEPTLRREADPHHLSGPRGSGGRPGAPRPLVIKGLGSLRGSRHRSPGPSAGRAVGMFRRPVRDRSPSST